jgi:DNA-binding response OmpR family regulator
LLRSNEALYTPEKNEIKLTSKEFYLLEMLASSPNKIVQRQTLLETLDYGNDEFGNRALDALIYRLRRKKGDRNEKLPIKTAHGAGYYFSSPIVIA